MTDQKQLEHIIVTYNEAYRKGEPIVSDQVYDELVETLKNKFPDSKLLNKGVIEQPQKESRKQKLPIPMYSLNKCKSLEEIRKWLKANNIPEDEPLVITPKYDGISLVVNEGTADCWTRGDGEVGQRSNIHFSKMPVKTLGEETFTFGEAIMSRSNFEQRRGVYANARNMVAGLFNRDVPTENIEGVDYMRYGSSETNLPKSVQLESLNELNSIGVPYFTMGIKHITEEMFDRLYEKWSKDYQIDGLVIEINSAKLRKELGREDNKNPRYARAYKNPKWSGLKEVNVTGVTWQVSKQGKLKPVIQIEPTEVSGVTVTNVTGYNAKYMFDNDIAEGSTIKIIRSGDVIPKHIETVSNISENVEELADEIAVCPSCGEPTIWDETMTEIICQNPECEERKIMKLVHFFSVLKIEDFGEPSIRTFYNNGYDTVDKILNMKQISIVNISGFGSKSSARLLSQFGKLKNEGVSAARLIHALDLMEGKIGEKTIQLIFDNYEDLNNLSVDKLIDIEGVSTITANVFIKGFKEYLRNWLSVLEVSFVQSPKPKIIGDKLKGERICFTGCRPSKEMEEKIQNQGGDIASGVSKNTTTLVVKDMSDKTLSSTKAHKAKQLGIRIVEIRKFEV